MFSKQTGYFPVECVNPIVGRVNVAVSGFSKLPTTKIQHKSQSTKFAIQTHKNESNFEPLYQEEANSPQNVSFASTLPVPISNPIESPETPEIGIIYEQKYI